MKRVIIVGAGVLLLMATSVIWFGGEEESGEPPCVVRIEGQEARFDQEQAKNAATIAAVARRMGLANRAVTIAIATAWQESELHNIDYGDRDSVGLFQQRSSQGWGSVNQIMSPEYAATAFFRRLTTVNGWQNMRVTDAAQAVQRSAFPEAYAKWEGTSRLMARALTGEVPAAFACKHKATAASVLSPAMKRALSNELGSVDFDRPFQPAQGWLVAGWLIGHSQQYEIDSLEYAGMKWTNSWGEWRPHTEAGNEVRINP